MKIEKTLEFSDYQEKTTAKGRLTTGKPNGLILNKIAADFRVEAPEGLGFSKIYELLICTQGRSSTVPSMFPTNKVKGTSNVFSLLKTTRCQGTQLNECTA